MKTLRFLCVGLAALCVLFAFTGCMFRPDSAATRVKITGAGGSSFEATFPKNLDAEDLALGVNPETKEFQFKSKKLKADASSVIEAAGAAQAQANAELTKTLSSLITVIAPYLVPQVPRLPAAPPAGSLQNDTVDVVWPARPKPIPASPPLTALPDIPVDLVAAPAR